MEVFALPVLDRTLVYAPLDRVVALTDDGVTRDDAVTAVAPLVGRAGPPVPRAGPVTDPAFLGLIPTRGCTMACPYCDFAAESGSPVMSFDTARRAIDQYLALVRRGGAAAGRVHFFGGEPFHAPAVVRTATAHARAEATRLGLRLHVEATTNGLYGSGQREWIARSLDAVVLSLDGPPDVLDRQRPGRGGRSVADVLVRSAARFRDGPVALHLRACVTDSTVHRLPEIAAWFMQFRPRSVCFESVHPTDPPLAGCEPPDPYDFAAAFLAAEEVLAAAGITAIMATAELDAPRVTFCPVGRDALIVSPDGAVDTCYLRTEDRHGDLRLGSLELDGFHLDDGAVARARAHGVAGKELCRDCFCRWHCAGGCHVNHPAERPAGSYDRPCLQTRIVTLHRLVRTAGEPALAAAWLGDRDAVGRAARQRDDRIAAGGAT